MFSKIPLQGAFCIFALYAFPHDAFAEACKTKSGYIIAETVDGSKKIFLKGCFKQKNGIVCLDPSSNRGNDCGGCIVLVKGSPFPFPEAWDDVQGCVRSCDAGGYKRAKDYNCGGG